MSSSVSSLPGMVFSSRAMADVARNVERIKDSNSTILVTGESGTGKELIARAIHRLSRRSESEFIPFNCSAVPAELIESMLFGHRRGTFTGAMSDQAGLIRSAENGTSVSRRDWRPAAPAAAKAAQVSAGRRDSHAWRACAAQSKRARDRRHAQGSRNSSSAKNSFAKISTTESRP